MEMYLGTELNNMDTDRKNTNFLSIITIIVLLTFIFLFT